MVRHWDKYGKLFVYDDTLDYLEKVKQEGYNKYGALFKLPLGIIGRTQKGLDWEQVKKEVYKR